MWLLLGWLNHGVMCANQRSSGREGMSVWTFTFETCPGVTGLSDMSSFEGSMGIVCPACETQLVVPKFAAKCAWSYCGKADVLWALRPATDTFAVHDGPASPASIATSATGASRPGLASTPPSVGAPLPPLHAARTMASAAMRIG